MTRAERVMALADRLRASAEVSVEALAAALSVSARTVRRDLAMLRDRGMPIRSEGGPGGGVRLEGGRGLTAVHLTVADAVALWLAARLVSTTTHVPWRDGADAALARIVASLPQGRARELRDLCTRVFIGPAASDAVRAGVGVPPPTLVGLFEAAVSAGVALRFGYRDRSGVWSERCVEPHGLAVLPPVWYIAGRDAGRDGARLFRMDRVNGASLDRAHRFAADVAVVRAALPTEVSWQPLHGLATRIGEQSVRPRAAPTPAQ